MNILPHLKPVILQFSKLERMKTPFWNVEGTYNCSTSHLKFNWLDNLAGFVIQRQTESKYFSAPPPLWSDPGPTVLCPGHSSNSLVSCLPRVDSSYRCQDDPFKSGSTHYLAPILWEMDAYLVNVKAKELATFSLQPPPNRHWTHSLPFPSPYSRIPWSIPLTFL
jgi:hypothetical protein